MPDGLPLNYSLNRQPLFAKPQKSIGRPRVKYETRYGVLNLNSLCLKQSFNSLTPSCFNHLITIQDVSIFRPSSFSALLTQYVSLSPGEWLVNRYHHRTPAYISVIQSLDEV
ncbi:hypothetical protein ACJ72_03843 [Emergomyces africanus]|uniref:Uncharacterized protein n=1 Tax=Emergomyces africanus TaxID=1955775 RepID=A0A1B7NYG4_9EURO|nr:hypothetical protein ACJ72_03843 [Emergomyces africanus]